MSMSAGWYDDGSGRQRWWDGAQWTDQYAEPQPGQPVNAQPVYVQPVAYIAVTPAGVSPKSYTAAWLFSLFLGGFAVDRFYLGNIGLGIAKLLVGWLTGGIWWLVDFLIVVTKHARDGQGLRVTNG